MRMIWSHQAEQDLKHIVDFIADDNPSAAWSVRDAIREHVGRLQEHSKLGKAGRMKGTRELVNPHFPAYIVVYQLLDEDIVILRVLRGSQQWPPK